MLRIFYLILFFLTTEAGAGTIDTLTKNIKISDNIAIKLTSETYTVKAITNLPDSAFEKYDGKSFGFTHETLWAKYPIENKSDISKWFITLYVSHVGKFQVYKVRNDGVITPVESVGRDLDASLRKIQLYPLQLNRASKDTLFLELSLKII